MNIVRDEHGKMILKIDNVVMATIVARCGGHFRPYRNNNKPVFEITDECWKISHAGMRIFLWKGTLIFPEID
jgi:hypothetical protein